MADDRYDAELDDWIVNILLPRQSELRYNQLEKELNLRHKVSTATFSAHLRRLVGGQILLRRREENGHTYYSLAKEFRIALESEKRHDPTNYVRNAFSRFDRTQVWFSFNKEVLHREYLSKDYRKGRKKKSK